MSELPRHPKLRWPIDLRMEHSDGSEYLVISCPLGIAEQPLVLVGAVAPIVAACDGTLSLEEIAQKFAPYGVPDRLIHELVSLLDTGLFLSTSRFFEADESMRSRYRASRERPAALAGHAYAADPTLLRHELDTFLATTDARITASKGGLIGLVSPHIDYRRGGRCYGAAYTALRGASCDLYIVIGTSHQYSPHLFHLSSKDFLTPLGTLPSDGDFVNSLADAYGPRAFQDEILHRREHSLELQLPFIAHLLGSVPIVPILVGGFHQMLSTDRSPTEYEPYEAFVSALASTFRQSLRQGRRVCVISGVDMAHVGRHFGDSGALSQEVMERVGARDRIYLDTILQQDKSAMWGHIAEDGDARRICGFPTMYTVIDLFDRLGIRYRASLLSYEQAVDYPRDCAVTFAGVSLHH